MLKNTKNRTFDKMNSETEIKVLEKSAMMFQKEGFKAVTMDSIAESLGMSKRTIYELFGDKKNLVFECLKYMCNQLEILLKSEIPEDANIFDKIVLIREKMDSIRKGINPLFFEELKYYPLSKEYIKEKNKKIRQRITKWIEDGQKQGLFEKDIDTEFICHLFVLDLNALKDEMEQEGVKKDANLIRFELNKILMRGIATSEGIEFIKKRGL